MNYKTYAVIHGYCWQDLKEYIDTPQKNAMLQLRLALVNNHAIGEIQHEYEVAREIFGYRNLTPRERAAACLLAVISNYRAITWQREPDPPNSKNPAKPLTRQA
jgi:hypothetical protein